MVIDSDKMNRNILLTNSILEHNNKNNKQKNKIISAKYYTSNKTMMRCSVKSNDNNMEHTGILAWHAYSILDIFEISKPRGRKIKKNRLLRIRMEWKMEWW